MVKNGIKFAPIEFLKDQLKLIEIDFSDKWWRVITKQKFYLVMSLIGEVIIDIFRPLRAFLIGWILTHGQLNYMIAFFATWVAIYFVELTAHLSNCRLQLTAIHSISFRAHQWFLQVDPIFHAHRSSGTVLAKIQDTSRAFGELIDALSRDLLETAVGISTAIVMLLFYSYMLAGVAFGLLLIIACITYVAVIYVIIPYEKMLLKAHAKAHSVSHENLSQINLIRTTFATDYLNNRLMRKIIKHQRKEGALWFLFNFFYLAIKLIYMSSMIIVMGYAFNAIYHGVMSVPVALGLVLSFNRGTHHITRIDRPIRRILRSIMRIEDLFSYINNYGKQSFPVLESMPDQARTVKPAQWDEITIRAENLYFDYNPTAKIFDDHSFNLTVPGDQENKLYGVIGPSGIGKSTFMLLMGGQLRPSSGSIVINGIDIYKIDDRERRKVIALQGQVASSMRGTLAYNLCFGLPKQCEMCTDELLIDVLEKVGLWEIFGHKEGLKTFVGEGGFTISGGQRQRLNFANLYLRSLYYKPYVIFIDEPTSSLDEVSELAITAMIKQLAKQSITLVIAHRLKTIEDAVGILDFSMLSQSKDIVFHPEKELAAKSDYYRQLITGHAPISE